MLRLNATNVDEARRLVRAHSGGRVRRVVDDLLDTVQLGTVRRYFEALGYELTVSLVPMSSPRT